MKNNKTNVGSFATAKLQAKRHSLLAIIALAAVIGFSFASCDPDDLLGGKEVAVTGVTLSDTNLYLTIGGSVTLTATVTPADATDKAVVWATGDANVATINNGKVTALAINGLGILPKRVI